MAAGGDQKLLGEHCGPRGRRRHRNALLPLGNRHYASVGCRFIAEAHAAVLGNGDVVGEDGNSRLLRPRDGAQMSSGQLLEQLLPDSAAPNKNIMVSLCHHSCSPTHAASEFGQKCLHWAGGRDQ
ncbi:unnamed protein product [Heligmosomoides polygyrus]|uniref:Uncharacterized protein n=1 Tax=Heligmosomoides polygyrus TaxID=6339 RepID=A0A183GTD4_HELPZ|nr:unnamed protein product [Heligmosomoides polygyrus]